MKKDLLNFLLGILASIIATYVTTNYTENYVILSFLAVVVAVSFFFLFRMYLPTAISYVRMYRVGRFRGLWSRMDLSNLIENEYQKSDEIKIKVTRGFGLFFDKKGIFHKCIFDNQYNETKIVKVLLHYPCLKSNHIVQRAKANLKAKEDYVEDLFKVLKLFKDHNQDPKADEKISVRFYTSDDEKEWRFYVFRQQSEDKVLLFNHYDDSTSGSKSRMLKVIGGHNSLCEELNNEFDKIYNNFSVELVENLNLSKKLINNDICGHPGCKQKITEIHNKIFNV